MNKQRPSALAMITMVAFTASCIGLLIFLWISFGGSVPFSAQGYRFSVEFNQATELAGNADVQIAGVPIGHVVSVRLDHRTGLERAVLEIDSQYVPRPADTRATLRQKTLLGETYVQLSPGNPKGPKLPDGGSIPQAHVEASIQLDQILDSFNPRTRHAFETWMQQGGVALTDRGEEFNTALADLYPFATNVKAVLAVLRRQGAATRTLLSDGGQVFSALSKSPAEIQSFVRNSNRTFATTAARNADLAATIQSLPAFITQTRQTINRITEFSRSSKALVDELHPAARQLTPALRSLSAVAPELKTLLTDVGPASDAAGAGLPSLRRFLTESVPFLTQLTPYLGNLDPVINYIESYRRELAGFFANGTAATEAKTLNSANQDLHYVRVAAPLSPEVLTPYQKRPETNRTNPYLVPGGYEKLSTGLPVFGSYLCTANALPALSPSLSSGTATTSVTGTVLTLAQLIQKYYITADPSGPACTQQPSLGKLTTGELQSFPSLKPTP